MRANVYKNLNRNTYPVQVKGKVVGYADYVVLAGAFAELTSGLA
jgi:hypothetical protein